MPYYTLVSTALAALLIVAGCGDSDAGGLGAGGDATGISDSGGGADTTGLGDAAAGADADASSPTDTASGSDATAGSDTPTVSDTGGTFCPAGTAVCSSLVTRKVCNPIGSDWLPDEMCPTDQKCTNGQCIVSCPNDPKFGVFAGCEYWAADLPNYPDPFLDPTPEDLPWALVVSNPRDVDITVAFQMPPLVTYAPTDNVVPGGTSRVFEMPSINVVGTSLFPRGVHLTASGPVVVHQFNPWDNTFSNDASLLMPDPMLGDEYFILSWPTSPFEFEVIPGFPTLPNQNGYFTVIAPFEDTTVSFRVTAPVRASGPIPALPAGALHTVKMNQGDVLSIQTDPESLFELADISGSFIGADKPISVFAGHEEAVIGDPVPDGEGGTSGPCCADHLEEQMLPVSMLTGNVFALKSPSRGTAGVEVDYWRILAADDNVKLTTDPPQPGAHGETLVNKGDWLEVQSAESFEITATGRILVAQYLVSRDATDDFTGDPSLVLAIPQERFRKDYAFAVPDKGYNRLHVSVVAPTGATVTIDDVAIAAGSFRAVGASGWSHAEAAITPGVHVASSAQTFGLYVYGYNNAVSFSYTGGMALPGE